jgi:hypothetical protein
VRHERVTRREGERERGGGGREWGGGKVKAGGSPRPLSSLYFDPAFRIGRPSFVPLRGAHVDRPPCGDQLSYNAAPRPDS